MVVTDFKCGPLLFSANFDSGNLAVVEQVLKCDEESTEKSYSEPEAFDYEYNLWTSPDAVGTINETGNRTWFHFNVRGSLLCKTVKFNIMNMNKQNKLFQQGMSPVFRTLPGKNSKIWKRIKEKTTFEFIDGQFVLTFLHRFTKYSTTYFAFCYPFSYQECQDYLKQLETQHCSNNYDSASDIYFHRDILCFTNDGLNIDLLTVSSMKNIQTDCEESLQSLFPDKKKKRPFAFKCKKIIFLTSRVHPGETPASFVFNGFLNFILREHDPRAVLLRDMFVFKLIPMLNPDGVKRGHYRSDALGLNLNRTYINPHPILQPSIYAVKKIMNYYHYNNIPNITYEGSGEERKYRENSLLRTKSEPTTNIVRFKFNQELDTSCSDKQSSRWLHKSYTFPNISSSKRWNLYEKSTDDMFLKQNCDSAILAKPSSDIYETDIHISKKQTSNSNCNTNTLSSNGNILMYVDLHAHASKRGCFIYGNHFEKEKEAIECMLYPKLISMNSSHFDFQACNFSEKNMHHKDKRDGLSKEGSGRVAIFKSFGIIHSYTLECNYNTGRSTNSLAPATCDDGRATPPPSPGFPPKYTPEHYEEVGSGMAVAILDLFQKNPWSRLPLSEHKSLNGVRDWLAKFVRNSSKSTVSLTATKKCGRTSYKTKNTEPSMNRKYIGPSNKHASRITINNFKDISIPPNFSFKDSPTSIDLTNKNTTTSENIITAKKSPLIFLRKYSHPNVIKSLREKPQTRNSQHGKFISKENNILLSKQATTRTSSNVPTLIKLSSANRKYATIEIKAIHKYIPNGQRFVQSPQ